MNPIINPWSIYLINVLSGLKNIFIAAVVAAIFVGIGNAIYFLIVVDDPYYDKDNEKYQNKILNIKKMFQKICCWFNYKCVVSCHYPFKRYHVYDVGFRQFNNR